MMLERVTAYLQAIEDDTRLDLVRRCFYLKVCEKLSRERACVGWRREVVSHLVKEWGWDEKRLMMLDNRANWKIDEVRKAHNELLDAMMQSYRNLIRFARRNNLSVSASPQDIGVLTRKLYAAFEALPGKVTLVNPQISPDLSEPNLTFIHVPPGRANRTGWYVYNRAPDMESIISHQPLEYNRYLNKLVAWAWFNGLLTSRTRLFIKGNGIVDLAKLQEMVADVRTISRCVCRRQRLKRCIVPAKSATWRLSSTSNMTRRRRSAIRSCILTSVNWMSLALAKSRSA
jgi:adenylate cyclase class 1